MIKVEFEVFGALRRKTKENKFVLSIPENSTIEDVVRDKLKFTKEEMRYFGYVVNEKGVKKNTILKDKDRVKILLLIGGG